MTNLELQSLQNLSITNSTNSNHPNSALLLRLSTEVLQTVCKYVFSDFKKSYDDQTKSFKLKFKVACPQFDLVDCREYPEDDLRMPWYNSISSSRQHLGLPKNTLALLSTCTELYGVGAPVFYGLYTFHCTSAEAFRLLFTKHIGLSSLSSIRKLVFGLPYTVKTMPSKYLGRHIRMLDHQMPQLREFTITTRHQTRYRPSTVEPGDSWIERHRGLLWFAAWVTRSHPLLKCAVWDERKIVTASEWNQAGLISLESPLFEMKITITGTKPKDTQVMPHPSKIEAHNQKLRELYGDPEPDEQGNLPYKPMALAPATRILLDSWKIRRTGWTGLATFDTSRPYPYQLPTTAKNSEVNRPSDADMGAQVFLEEMLLHNKTPETTIARLDGEKYNTHVLCLRAKALEEQNIKREMLMKCGLPPPALVEDEAQNNDDGHENDGNDGDGGGADGWNSLANPWEYFANIRHYMVRERIRILTRELVRRR